jgi:peptidoglycan/LPS O-acetylase OafA/YrhL
MLACVFIFPLFTFMIRQFSSPLFSGIDPYWLSVYWERFPFNSIGSFSFGILLYFLLKDEGVLSFIRRKAVGICSILMVCGALFILGMLPVVYPVRAHFYCFLFMLLALLLSANPFKVFVNPATLFIGRISYSIYIFHFAVLKWLTVFIPTHYPHLLAHSYLYFFVVTLLVVCFTVPLAWCGYQFIESPAINCSKRLIARLESNVRTA